MRHMRSVLLIAMMFAVLGAAAGCENRPPIDVYGHKDSVYKRLVIGIPI
jgi:hypothetical protein